MDESDDLLRAHSYDGIQEYDNPLPGWWTNLFIGSILFSAVYMFYYHAGVPGRRVYDDYDAAVAENIRLQFAEIGELTPDAATITKYMNNKEWIKVGESVYKGNCVSCHGGDGQGLVGPNLCDDFYKNVTKIEDLAKVVAEGAAGNAMPAWRTRLHPNEIVLVASYVATMRGTNPGNPKPPYGQKIPPWTTTAEAEGKAAESGN